MLARRSWLSLSLLIFIAADPRRLWQHHQPHLQTSLLKEEACNHLTGPQHQVCTAVDRQTGNKSECFLTNIELYTFTNAADAFKERHCSVCFCRACSLQLPFLRNCFCLIRSSAMIQGGSALLCRPLNTSLVFLLVSMCTQIMCLYIQNMKTNRHSCC